MKPRIFTSYLGLTFLTLLPSCSSVPQPTKSQSGHCLIDTEIKERLTQGEKIADAFQEKKSRTTTLLADQCWKRLYLRGTYRIALARGIDGTGVDMNTGPIKKNTLDPGPCLARAISDIRTLAIPGSEEIISHYSDKNKARWDDPDFGPVTWLQCNSTPDIEYNESLGVLLHELNHIVREGSTCPFVARTGKFLCFTGETKLPTRSIAKLDSFPTKKKEALSFLFDLQRTYLTNTDQPYPMLLDELNAYTVQTRTVRRLLEVNGPASLSDGKSRGLIVLPLFMVYTANYLERARTKEPKLFEEVLGKGTSNREQLDELLLEAETEYRAWLSAYSKSNLKKIDLEDNLWRQYLNQKRKLQTTERARSQIKVSQ